MNYIWHAKNILDLRDIAHVCMAGRGQTLSEKFQLEYEKYFFARWGLRVLLSPRIRRETAFLDAEPQ